MAKRFDSVIWRARAIAALAQLTTIFIGVTLAFLFEGYRKQIDEAADLRQAVAGIISELGHYAERGTFHALQFEQSIEAWRAADRAGHQAAPMLYRLPGALTPPAAAWESALSSGAASHLDPSLKLEIGYFYNEMLGIHANYRRQVDFAEREVMPRALQGAAAFYGSDGRLLPAFQVHIALIGEFADDLKRLSLRADELKKKLEGYQAH
ncbi:MAG TPA: hypothetical protein VFL07_04620 [Rudaea sp.]|jgi:hypothetical protein|nr:hypothetical protein [Rudaea sp.]HSC11681.1 hypothetical protein [Rhodanobacteraceae bacterium]